MAVTRSDRCSSESSTIQAWWNAGFKRTKRIDSQQETSLLDEFPELTRVKCNVPNAPSWERGRAYSSSSPAVEDATDIPSFAGQRILSEGFAFVSSSASSSPVQDAIETSFFTSPSGGLLHRLKRQKKYEHLRPYYEDYFETGAERVSQQRLVFYDAVQLEYEHDKWSTEEIRSRAGQNRKSWVQSLAKGMKSAGSKAIAPWKEIGRYDWGSLFLGRSWRSRMGFYDEWQYVVDDTGVPQRRHPLEEIDWDRDCSKPSLY